VVVRGVGIGSQSVVGRGNLGEEGREETEEVGSGVGMDVEDGRRAGSNDAVGLARLGGDRWWLRLRLAGGGWMVRWL
jgi:hypothetical protein